MNRRLRLAGLAIALAAACGEEKPALSVSQADIAQSFAAGSLVIPMDTTDQDQGTLSAFGLVDALLRAQVPVSLTIANGKAVGGVDFTAGGVDVRTGAAVASHGYRGGPFVIDAFDRGAALPVVRAWQASAVGQSTTVHDITAPFSAQVRRRLTAAPHIGVFLDGFEFIAFGYLNAAGIPDSTGQAWPTVTATQASYPGFPDVLTPAAIKSGALSDPDGTPRYCAVSSMHYAAPVEDAVVAAVRQYLTGAGTAAQFECEAAHAFENSASGHFLTTGGIQDDRTGPNPLPNPNSILFPDNPYSQLDGSFLAVTGMLQSIGLAAGSAFKGNGVVLVQAATAVGTNTRMAYLTGFLDGITTNGKVSYLAGHQYPTTMPISANPSTNGVRLYLDATYQSTCTAAEGQPEPTLRASVAAAGTTLTFTISYANPGPGGATSAVLTNVLPAGLSFVSASAGAAVSGQTVTWTLGNLKAGASGLVTVTATSSSPGTYVDQASLSFVVSLTPRAVTASASAVVSNDTPPVTAITSRPDPVSHVAEPVFAFISSKPGSTFVCTLDGGAPAVCASPLTYPAVAPGGHVFTVAAVDAAGVADPSPASYRWTFEPLQNALAMTGGGCSTGGGADLLAALAVFALLAFRRRGATVPAWPTNQSSITTSTSHGARSAPGTSG